MTLLQQVKDRITPDGMASERVRQVTIAAGEPNWDWELGAIWIVPAGVAMPVNLERNSEPFTGALPHTALVFDATDYARANMKRAEPTRAKELTEADICKTLGLSPAQFQTAQACGFPKSSFTRTNASTLMGRLLSGDEPVKVVPYWYDYVVEKWAEAIRSLNLGGR